MYSDTIISYIKELQRIRAELIGLSARAGRDRDAGKLPRDTLVRVNSANASALTELDRSISLLKIDAGKHWIEEVIKDA